MQELTALNDEDEPFGVLRVHDQQSLEAAQELVALAHARNRIADVVVITPTTPTTASRGAKENQNGHRDQGANRQGAGTPR